MKRSLLTHKKDFKKFYPVIFSGLKMIYFSQNFKMFVIVLVTRESNKCVEKQQHQENSLHLYITDISCQMHDITYKILNQLH